MKTANTGVLALSLLLAAGSAAAQENQMGMDARSHDASTASHGSMKKKAMDHGSMKMGMKSKGSMPNDAASKSSDMMKHDTAGQAGMGDKDAQH
jgi:hypothetical protein